MPFTRRSETRSYFAVVLALLGLAAPAAGDDMGAGEVRLDGEEAPAAEEAPAVEEVPLSARIDEIGSKALDAVVLRPLGAAATVTGFALFLCSVPLVAIPRRIPETWDIFVLGPADYTFRRPLGDF